VLVRQRKGSSNTHICIHALFLLVCVGVCVSNYLNQRLDAITVFHVLDRAASGEKDKNLHCGQMYIDVCVCELQGRLPVTSQAG